MVGKLKGKESQACCEVIMDIPEEKKLDVLMAQLKERYTALHNMRDRSTRFALWILGLGLGMAWLLISGIRLSTLQAIELVVFLIFVGILSINLIRAIQRGFSNNRDVMVKIETLLKLHEKGAYSPGDSILPKEFSDSRFKWSGHFPTLYMLMITVFFLLIILTLTNLMYSSTLSHGPQRTPQIQKQP